MKKLIQTLILLSFLPIAAIGQTIHVFGTVMQNDQPAANADVYAMIYSPAFSDTLATAVTNNDGVYNMELPADENDSLIVWMSTSACPDTTQLFYLAGAQSVANLSCGGNVVYQELFIGAQSISDDDLEWYFTPSITSDVSAYSWNIDGQNFTTATVTHTFPEAGEYNVSLTVILNNGNIYSESISIVVGSTGSGNGPSNCQSLFFALSDSVIDGAIYFVNSSLGNNLTYLWNFGDGTTSSEAYPTHTFADDEATYNVCLLIFGDNCQQQYCMEVSGSLDGSGFVVVGGKPQKDPSKSGTFEFIVIPVYSGPTGVNDALAPLDFTLFPNPSTGNVSVQIDLPTSENGVINITDIAGKIVAQKPVSGTGSLNTVIVNMDKLADGTYLLQYQGESISKVQKVILQR